jgi:hypothetical protein
MAKKQKKTAKRTTDPSKGAVRWTIRGVPSRLQRAAGDAARARGLTLGQWVSQALDEALDRNTVASNGESNPWVLAMEERVARLEARILARDAAEAATSELAAAPTAVAS